MRPVHRGFTLLELMFAVAVVGILVAVAVVAYTKNVRKARSGEIPQMFGEMKMREEAWHSERGFYLALCPGKSGTPTDGDCNETEFWPTTVDGSPQDATAPPERWQTLRVNVPKAQLYCQYVVVAGKGGTSTNIGTKGLLMFTGTPSKNWYYLVAQCDWDGDGSIKSMYWQRDDWTELGIENEGR